MVFVSKSTGKRSPHHHRDRFKTSRQLNKKYRKHSRNDSEGKHPENKKSDAYRKRRDSSSDSYRKDTNSSTESKHHKHSKKHKKKKKSKRKHSKRDMSESKSLINEIAQNVLIGKNFDKDVNNNSYTPPLPQVDKFTFNPPLPPSEDEKEKVQEPKSIEEEVQKKKKSVLDLPMPPIIIPQTGTIVSSLSKHKHDDHNWEKKFTQSFYPLHNNSNEHKEEMKNHLKTNSIILTPGYSITPEPIRRLRPRPTIIGNYLRQNFFQGTNEKDFVILEQIGEGTYGKVYKAMNIVNGKIVAMKLTRMENEHQGFPITSLREIKNLQILKHPNIVKLDDVVFTLGKNRAYLVFEFMNHDLLGLMNNLDMIFSEETIYHIISQVLEGLKYCHEKQIIHRDLKPSNILLNNQGIVKLADFGLSRCWIPDRPYTNKVISLWYRPIELLLGEEHYKPAVDVWSVGCIM